MSELLNENNTEKIQNASSARSPEQADRLNSLKQFVDKANKDAAQRISERERSARATELENEKRLAETKAKIAENAARAERLADERAARMEYGGEYRQRLMARENKKAAEEKRLREEAEKETARIRETERKKQIEEFVRLEREAAMKRAAAADEIFAFSSKPVAETNVPAEQKTQSSTDEDKEETKITADENKEETKITADEDKKEETEITVDDGAVNGSSSVEGESERIILEITSSGIKPESQEDGENVIRIGGVQYHAPSSYAPVAQNGFTSAPFDRELSDAAEKHAALRLAAVARAAGVYRDEIRLLEEEELRYNREIAEIQAKRIEYAERREFISASNDAAFSSIDEGSYGFSDDLTKRYEEFSDSLAAGARLYEEDELSRYEKYREENEIRKEEPKQADFGNSAAAAMEYGYYEPFAVPPKYPEASEYPDALAQPYSAPERELGVEKDDYLGDQELLMRYEASLEAERLADAHEDESLPREDTFIYKVGDANGFAKFALAQKLSDYRKREAVLSKKIKKLAGKQNSVSGEEKTVIIVEKIGIRKEITELAVEALTACVYAKARFKTITYKRVLTSQIYAYNAACDEYETHTGRPLTRLSAEMADEVAAGKICAPIPNVYYYGSELYGAREEKISVEEEKSHRLAEEAMLEEAEFHRLLSENYPQELTRTEILEKEKRQAEKMSAIKRAAERDLLLIGLRQDYRLSRLESEYDMLLHSFSTDKKKKDKRLASIERKISRMRSDTRRALKLERGDNSRYYMLFAMDGESEKTKKRANRERLNALKMRLEILLSEREEINERLIALYGGTDKKLTKTKINRKAAAVRKKHAKFAYRKQRSIANRIDKIRAPLDMKEKAYALLNKKTACIATIEECHYKLRRLKPSGRARRELISDIRRAKAAMRTVDSDVKFLIKKMRRHEQRREDDRRWAGFLVMLVLIAAAGVALWYFYKDDILSYFTDLFSKLGIGG